MGTWGTTIFADDLAMDIRDDFRDLIGNGKTPEEATQEIKKQYVDSINDRDESVTFWLALASVQWQLGRLQEEVKNKALEIISNGSGLELWDNPKDRKKREIVLQKLKEQLLAPQPTIKKVPKRFIENTPYEIGDVLRYKTNNDRYLLFRVIGHHSDKGGRFSICELLDWIGITPEISEEEISKLPIKYETVFGDKSSPSCFMIASHVAKNFPADRVELVMKGSKPAQNAEGYFVMFWKNIEDQLTKVYDVKT